MRVSLSRSADTVASDSSVETRDPFSPPFSVSVSVFSKSRPRHRGRFPAEMAERRLMIGDDRSALYVEEKNKTRNRSYLLPIAATTHSCTLALALAKCTIPSALWSL